MTFSETIPFNMGVSENEEFVEPKGPIYYLHNGEKCLAAFGGYVELPEDGHKRIGIRISYAKDGQKHTITTPLNDAKKFCRTYFNLKEPLFKLRIERSKEAGGEVENDWYFMTSVNYLEDEVVRVVKYLENGKQHEKLVMVQDIIRLNVD